MPNVKFVIVDASGAVQGMGSNEAALVSLHVAPGLVWFRQDGSLGHDLEQIPVDPATLDSETVYGMVNGVFGPTSIVAVIGPTVDPEDVRSVAIAQINVAAGAARLRYITDLPGQEAIYGEKKDEAISYLAVQPAVLTMQDYPFLLREIGVTAPSAYELAQLWLNMDAIWRPIAAEIEGIRLEGVYAVKTANDPDSIGGWVQQALDALSEL